MVKLIFDDTGNLVSRSNQSDEDLLLTWPGHTLIEGDYPLPDDRYQLIEGVVTVIELPTIEPVPFTEEEVRSQRDVLLSSTDFYVTRHRDQESEGTPFTLTQDEYNVILRYRQVLRDIPQQSGFPDNVIWPDMDSIRAHPSASSVATVASLSDRLEVIEVNQRLTAEQNRRGA